MDNIPAIRQATALPLERFQYSWGDRQAKQRRAGHSS